MNTVKLEPSWCVCLEGVHQECGKHIYDASLMKHSLTKNVEIHHRYINLLMCFLDELPRDTHTNLALGCVNSFLKLKQQPTGQYDKFSKKSYSECNV